MIRFLDCTESVDGTSSNFSSTPLPIISAGKVGPCPSRFRLRPHLPYLRCVCFPYPSPSPFRRTSTTENTTQKLLLILNRSLPFLVNPVSMSLVHAEYIVLMVRFPVLIVRWTTCILPDLSRSLLRPLITSLVVVTGPLSGVSGLGSVPFRYFSSFT